MFSLLENIGEETLIISKDRFTVDVYRRIGDVAWQ